MKKYFLIFTLIVFIALPASGFASVEYTNLGNLTTHSCQYYDLDQNGVYDIGVVWSYENWDDSTSAEASLPVGAPDDNGFLASGSLSDKLSQDSIIGADGTYKSDTVMLSKYWDDWDYTYCTWGNWDNMGEQDTAYLGFRFLDSDNAFHYGWIKAYVNPENQYITLYGIAWETTAGKAISAGDIGSAVPVPSAFWLLGAGLTVLAGIKKTR